MWKNRKFYLTVIILLIAGFYLMRDMNATDQEEPYRNFSGLVYTKHAECRMDCRQITEQEITEILTTGRLNRQKSGYDKKHNNETYALEGYSHEKQHIRVVVTPQGSRLLVITVIDLDKEWACDCN